MIDILTEQTASLSEAAKWNVWPRRRGGKRPSVSFLYRLAKHGQRHPATGAPIKLETIRFCGSLVTSKEAAARFIFAMNVETDQPLIGNFRHAHVARSRAAEEQLVREGF